MRLRADKLIAEVIKQFYKGALHKNLELKYVYSLQLCYSNFVRNSVTYHVLMPYPHSNPSFQSFHVPWLHPPQHFLSNAFLDLRAIHNSTRVSKFVILFNAYDVRNSIQHTVSSLESKPSFFRWLHSPQHFLFNAF